MRHALLFKSCSGYWAPRAQLAVESARAHNPDYDIHLVTDGKYAAPGCYNHDGPKLYGTNWIPPCQPGAMLMLLEQGYDSVLFVDSDTYTYGPYVEAQKCLDSGASILVTPHITSPLPLNEDLEPSIGQIARVGNYNGGFVGATRKGIPFLRFWYEATQKFSYMDAKNYIGGEQTGLRFALDFDDYARVFKHPGYNWAYWNATQRPLSMAQSGEYLASNFPLRMVHFSGFDGNIAKMSKYQNRDRLTPDSIEYQLFANYQSELVAGGGFEPPTPAL